MNKDLGHLQRELNRVIEQAGQMIISAAGESKNIRKKGRIDLVTETDLAVENFLKEKLTALEPASRFLAEETASDAELLDMTWIIDPVDGTTNFAHSLPFVATSVALWLNGEVVMGTVNTPLLGELFTACKGGGAHCNGTPIQVSPIERMEDSLAATGFPYATELYLKKVLVQMETMLKATQGIRRPGAAAIDMAYVACGRYEMFYEYDLKPWDTAAGCLLVAEAGGQISRMDGSPYSLGAKDILASNSRLHKQAVDLLQGALTNI